MLYDAMDGISGEKPEDRNRSLPHQAGDTSLDDRFRALFDHSLDALLITDRHGKIISANGPACDLFGMTEAELLRTGEAGLVDPHDPNLLRYLEERRTTGNARQELSFIRKNGGRFRGSVKLFPVGSGGDACMIIRETTDDDLRREELEFAARFPMENPNPVFRLDARGLLLYRNPAGERLLSVLRLPGDGFPENIRTRALEALSRKRRLSADFETGSEVYQLDLVPDPRYGSINIYGREISAWKQVEETMKAVFEQAAVGIAQISPDGTFLRVNDRHCEILRRSEKELHHLTVFDVTHPEDRELTRNTFERLKAGETGTFTVESRGIQGDGKVVWVRSSLSAVYDGSGAIRYFLSVLDDITRSKAFEDELSRRLMEFQALVEHSPDAVVRFDRSLRLLYVNPATLHYLDSDARQLLSGSVHEINADSELAPAFLDVIPKVFTENQEHSLTAFIRTSEGRRYFHFRLVPEVGPGGGVETVLAVGRDVTDLKRLEEELRQATEQALAASRAKSEFLATMSHEIRTPISGILGMVEVLSRRMVDGEFRTYLSLMGESAKSLLSVIGDILDLARIESGKEEIRLERFDPAREVERLLAPFRLKAGEKGLSLTLHVSPDIPREVSGDREKYIRVLRNLISNAVKYTEHGSVSVELESRPEGEHLVQVCCRVRDTGLGIPENRLKDLFKSFTRLHGSSTEKTEESTGLGLSITKRLVHLLGGTIDVESRFGAGSVFSCSIPFTLLEPSPAGQNELPPHSPSAVLLPLRILLAEDNAINRLFLETVFRDYGHSVEAVTNGAAAVEAARSAEFDLILMDIQMPEMDGLEATGAIRALGGARGRIPIVALTAFALKGDTERFLAAGMDGYVAKPIELEVLFTEITRVLGERKKAG